MKGAELRRRVLAAGAILAGGLATATTAVPAHAAGPQVLLVGTFNGVTGPYTTIQQAVDAAQADYVRGTTGDWILVGPGVYHERGDYTEAGSPAAGVVIRTPGLHLRGMVRGNITPSTSGVIIDGTKPGSPVCSAKPSDQDYGPNNQGRNGIEVFGQKGAADNVSIDNLFVCNFLTSTSGAQGNEVWWNGGDGGGVIGMHGYEGSYLTATSLYANADVNNTLGGACCGVNYPAGSYGIFSSDATRATDGTMASWTYDYASNMADSSYYIGACQQRCDAVMDHDHGQGSALCISTTNAGGYLLVNHMTCDLNKTGPVSNAQNNDDRPSPQIGYCDAADPSEPQVGATGTNSCVVWENSTFSNNNNPNVPGNGTSGLAGGGPVGTGMILAATRGVTVTHNTIENNNSWGELVVDLPDQEAGPSNCQGGILLSPPGQTPVCYFPSGGNVSLANTFLNNGAGYGVPNGSLGDIGLATAVHTNPPFDITTGNCFAGDTDAGQPGGAPTSDPPLLETNPIYAPTNGVCTQTNAGDTGPLLAQAECASQLLAPCPTLNTLCLYGPVPCVPVPTPLDYPRPTVPFTLAAPPNQTTMPDPCAGVPANAFCATVVAATVPTPSVGSHAAVPAALGAGLIGVGTYIATRRRRRSRRGGPFAS
jgi:hypothetical protein